MSSGTGKKLCTDEVIRRAQKFIGLNYHKNLTLETVAGITGLSTNYFLAYFKQKAGISFQKYLTQIRIEKAMKLLKESNLSSEAISAEVGYENPNYFIRVFKKETGMTVSESRKK